MLSPNLRPICRPVHTGFFQSREFRQLPDDGHARILLMALLVHPHEGSFHLPGLYQVGRESLREIASMPKKSFNKGLEDLFAADILDADEENRLFWVQAALRLVGPPGNPNVVKGYARSLGQLPPSRLVTIAVQAYLGFLKPFGPAFWQPFAKAFVCLPDGSEEAFTNPSRSVDPNFPNNNSNTNTDLYSDTNTNTDSLAVSLAQPKDVLAFAAGAGWEELNEARVMRWLKSWPRLTTAQFLQAAAQLGDRRDIRDPLAYIATIVRRSPPGGTSAVEQLPHTAGAVPLKDGEEVRFHD